MHVLAESLRRDAVTSYIVDSQPANVGLRLARVEDATFILSLRTDPEKSRYLSGVQNDLSIQEDWLRSYLDREMAGKEFYFVIYQKQQHHIVPVGTVRMYDFTSDSFCWGSWVICSTASSRVAMQSARMVYCIGFEVFGYERSHFDVRRENLSVNRFHARMGAKIVRENSLDVFYEITKPDVEAYFQRPSRAVKLNGE